MVAALPTPKQRRAVNTQPRPRLSARLQSRQDKTTHALSVKISRMLLNDALVSGNLRLEWVQPENSYHHFVLWVDGTIRGKVEVRSGYPSRRKVKRLASLLVWLGFTEKARLLEGGVEELPKLNRVPNLFTLSDEQGKEDAAF